MSTQAHLDLLGLKVKDKVTGFKGVVTSMSFDLYGCIQAIVTPEVNDKGATGDSQWFDVARLTVRSDKPVMDLPDFEQGYVATGKKGPAAKSIPDRF